MRNEIEKEFIQKINELFKNFNSRLSAKGITYDIQFKSDESPVVENYSSEVEINFYINNQFFDIIEFFIFRNGTLNIDKASIFSELACNIEEIIDKN
jgi:short-subunit dehydrogenase involved in D-alanine esterification of teichoic acids